MFACAGLTSRGILDSRFPGFAWLDPDQRENDIYGYVGPSVAGVQLVLAVPGTPPLVTRPGGTSILLSGWPREHVLWVRQHQREVMAVY